MKVGDKVRFEIMNDGWPRWDFGEDGRTGISGGFVEGTIKHIRANGDVNATFDDNKDWIFTKEDFDAGRWELVGRNHFAQIMQIPGVISVEFSYAESTPEINIVLSEDTPWIQEYIREKFER